MFEENVHYLRVAYCSVDAPEKLFFAVTQVSTTKFTNEISLGVVFSTNVCVRMLSMTIISCMRLSYTLPADIMTKMKAVIFFLVGVDV